MRQLLLILFIPLALFAYRETIGTELVKIESKLFSKIIFLDYNYRKKLVNGEVVIFIIHDGASDEEVAEKFAEELDGKKIFGKKIRVIIDTTLIKKIVPTAYIIIAEPINAEVLLERLISKNRLIFVTYEDQIEYGMVSVHLGSRIVPIINTKILKRGNIELRSLIFKVAKVYGDED